MKKWLLYIVLLILFPLACNKETQIEVPSQSGMLVLNGQWQQQSFFIVWLTRSRGISDPFDTGTNLINTYEVKNAIITVKENNILMDTLIYDSANYRYMNSHLNKRTKLNANYTVDASVKGYTPISSTSYLSSLMTISNSKLKRNTGFNASGDALAQISFSFMDDGSKTDYYLIRIRRADGSFATCIQTADHDFEAMVFDDPFTIEPCIDGNKLLLSDKNFNGQTKNVVITVSNDQMNSSNFLGRIRRPYIELLHITEDFFKYIKSNNSYDIASANPFAEPTNVYGNVKNGYGFFTTYSYVTDTLR